MTSRSKLHEELCKLLGTRNVYFQPPASVNLKFPAIVYSLGGIANDHADNSVYRQSLYYEITLIDKNPDSEFVIPLSQMPRCRFDRHFKSDNLNHYVFTIYFY